MVMLSDSESNPKDVAQVAVADDVRDVQVDPLLTFSSEGTTSHESDPARSSPISQPAARFTAHQVPLAIIDDRATREAIRRLEACSDTLVKFSEIGASMDERLEKAEATLNARLVDAERAIHELSLRIEASASGTDEAVRRIEQVLADRRREELAALEELQAVIETRLSRAERVAVPVVTHAPARPGISPWIVPPRWQSVMKRVAAAGALIGVVTLGMMMRAPLTSGSQPLERVVARERLVQGGLIEAPTLVAPDPVSAQSQPPVPTRTPAAPAPLPLRRAAPAEIAPRAFVGDLSIASTPAGATVFINGRAAGVTPLVLYERPAGSVAVQIASDGFERWSASVQVRAGQTTNVTVTLRRARP